MCKGKKSRICFISTFLLLSFLVLSKGNSAEINANKRIAYIYSYDTQTGNSFKDFLQENAFFVELFNKDDLSELSGKRYYCVIIGPETGLKQQSLIQKTMRVFEEDRWTSDSMQHIINTHSPILGIGNGGYKFFGKLGIDIGKNGATGGELTYTYPLDPGHLVWNKPNKVVLSPDGRAVIYKKEQPGAAKHKKHMNLAEEPFDKCGYDFGFSNLIADKKFYFLWGFDGSPDLMTNEGKKLFLNIMALIRFYNQASSK